MSKARGQVTVGGQTIFFHDAVEVFGPLEQISGLYIQAKGRAIPNAEEVARRVQEVTGFVRAIFVDEQTGETYVVGGGLSMRNYGPKTHLRRQGSCLACLLENIEVASGSPGS